MNSKGKALDKFAGKKMEIRERLAESRHIPTSREKQIAERNSGGDLRKEFYKDRHERKHGGGSRTSKTEALERAKLFSKER